jgi:hypothetical protein
MAKLLHFARKTTSGEWVCCLVVKALIANKATVLKAAASLVSVCV